MTRPSGPDGPPSATGSPMPRYGWIARGRDWWQARADGRAGLPSLEPGRPSGTPTLEEYAPGLPRPQSTASACASTSRSTPMLETRATLAARIPETEQAAARARARLDAMPVLLDDRPARPASRRRVRHRRRRRRRPAGPGVRGDAAPARRRGRAAALPAHADARGVRAARELDPRVRGRRRHPRAPAARAGHAPGQRLRAPPRAPPPRGGPHRPGARRAAPRRAGLGGRRRDARPGCRDARDRSRHRRSPAPRPRPGHRRRARPRGRSPHETRPWTAAGPGAPTRRRAMAPAGPARRAGRVARPCHRCRPSADRPHGPHAPLGDRRGVETRSATRRRSAGSPRSTRPTGSGPMPYPNQATPDVGAARGRVRTLVGDLLPSGVDEGTGAALDPLIASWASGWLSRIDSQHADHQAVIDRLVGARASSSPRPRPRTSATAAPWRSPAATTPRPASASRARRARAGTERVRPAPATPGARPRSRPQRRCRTVRPAPGRAADRPPARAAADRRGPHRPSTRPLAPRCRRPPPTVETR